MPFPPHSLEKGNGYTRELLTTGVKADSHHNAVTGDVGHGTQ